jgi:uncharacterized membrane protein
MSAYLFDWLNLAGRWIHLITGIAWIGSSFYFVWLDNHLLAPADPEVAKRGVRGELWSVHGGGFYHSQKYPVSPPALPGTLHWFYWEAYSTFLSGVFLLVLQYFGQADLYLIDPAVADLSRAEATGTAIALIVGAWFVYDGLCRTRLAKRGPLLGGIVAALLAVAAWGLCELYSGRGAFVLFGAMLGTIMVANVFFVIIPGQRAVVAALRDGREPDPEAGARGKLRSVHNTYFTLPVLFAMLSNHYAFLFGARHNFLVLIAMCAAGALIRTWFVLRHKAHERGGGTPAWPAIAGLALLAGVAIVLAPRPTSGASARAATGGPSSYDRVLAIVAVRCAGCHARKPTQLGFAEPPKGVMLETPEQIIAHLPQLALQVRTRVMPIGNLSGMTEDERTELLDWVDHGAPR